MLNQLLPEIAQQLQELGTHVDTTHIQHHLCLNHTHILKFHDHQLFMYKMFCNNHQELENQHYYDLDNPQVFEQIVRHLNSEKTHTITQSTMTPTDILNAIAQALNEDTYKTTRNPGTITIHVPTTGKTHTITYNPHTTEIDIQPEGIEILDNINILWKERTSLNISDPNLFHKIHKHLNSTEKPAIPLPCGNPPPPENI